MPPIISQDLLADEVDNTPQHPSSDPGPNLSGHVVWSKLELLPLAIVQPAGAPDRAIADLTALFVPALDLHDDPTAAERLLVLATAAKILLSRATQELVCEHLPPDVALRDLGEHHLKDLTRPEHVFQLVSPDLPAEFPPLTSLDAHHANLPVPSTPLVAREQAVVTTRELLGLPDVRLLTLTGADGSSSFRLS
jgi:hypothetical protein